MPARVPTAAVNVGGKNFLFYVNTEKELKYWQFTDVDNPAEFAVEDENDNDKIVKVSSGGISAIVTGGTGSNPSPKIRVFIVGGSNTLEDWYLDTPNGEQTWKNGDLSKRGYKTADNAIVCAIPDPLRVIFEQSDDDKNYWAAFADQNWQSSKLKKFKIPK